MNQNDAKKLLDRNRVGALLRIFANSPEVIEYRVESALAAARKLLDVEIEGMKVFSRVDFLVSNDQRYQDSDCAETTQHLRKAMDETFGDDFVRVLDIKQGDVFCMLLNYGIANHLEDRVPYTFIISHTAHDYITENNVAAMLSALQNKARVAGLGVKGLATSVAEGRIVNTFSAWHNKSLMTVGGFDLRSAKPFKDSVCDTVSGMCVAEEHEKSGEDMTYHVAGCEEIIPLIRMIRNFGPCIRPIVPEDATLSWGTDEKKDPVDFDRNLAKFATKELRQKHFASLVDSDFDFIQTGILS